MIWVRVRKTKYQWQTRERHWVRRPAKRFQRVSKNIGPDYLWNRQPQPQEELNLRQDRQTPRFRGFWTISEGFSVFLRNPLISLYIPANGADSESLSWVSPVPSDLGLISLCFQRTLSCWGLCSSGGWEPLRGADSVSGGRILLFSPPFCLWLE